MTAATAKRVAVKANSPKKKAAPTKHVELPKPPEKPPIYPKGVRVYSYQPEDGSESILLPLNGFDMPDKLWFFDMAQLPRLSQTWKWLDKAKVPKDIQRRAQMLSDAEYFEMFDEWFTAMTKFRGDGPEGVATSGK